MSKKEMIKVVIVFQLSRQFVDSHRWKAILMYEEEQ